MSEEPARIEFLEPPEDPAGDPDGIAWLDGGDEEDLGARGDCALPPRTTTHRVAASLLIFALALGTTGFAGVSAFRHDEAVRAAANALVLREVDVGDPVTLTDPGALGGLGAWTMRPSAAIAVDVTNESPDPITLLPGATLFGPGLIAPAELTPSGTTLLKPGQNGRLTGVATVDCGLQTKQLSSLDQNNAVIVQARTAGGAVGAATVALDAGGESVRQEICVEEGSGLAASFFPETVDATKHTFTVTVSAHSLAAQALHYDVIEVYETGPMSAEEVMPVPVYTSSPSGGEEPIVPGMTTSSVLPGVTLSAPTPVGTVGGTLAVGASMTAGFTVRVLSCPHTMPTMRAAMELEVLLDDHGAPALFQANGFDLDTLVGAACGLLG